MRINPKFGSFLTILALASGCGEDEDPRAGWPAVAFGTDTGDDAAELPPCVDGDEEPCECDNGWDGTRLCLDDGSGFGECGECQDPNPVVCGDEVCDPEESCWGCAEDCGVCLDCNAAPNCEGAAIPGLIDAHLEDLDIPATEADMSPLELAAKLDESVHTGEPGMRIVVAALDDPSAGEHPLVPALRDVFERFPEQTAIVRAQLEAAGMGSPASYRERFPDHELAVQEPGSTAAAGAGQGTDNCEPAKLRIRLSKIKVLDEFDLVTKDKIYCAIITEAASAAEIRVTPTTSKLAAGDQFKYALAEGVIWGQIGTPVAPMGNLMVTYNCLEADDLSGFKKFLEAIGEAALGATPIPSAYGWIVPVGGLAAEIIAAALALSTDAHLFNAAQVIPAELQLEMTNGVWWMVARKGKQKLKKWHWRLYLEAWGCTDDGVIEEMPPTE
jgi:hypothetical protein